MAVHEFQIGTSLASMVNLASIGVFEPAWEVPASDQFELGNSQTEDVGWLETTWHWGFFGSSAFDALRVYVPGRSATVYIRTKTSTNHYENYECVAEWPKRENWVASRVLDFTLRFKDMTLL